jgi:hypothetical protein
MSTNTPTVATPYAQALQDTVDDFGRCTVPWGVCPEHGATVLSRGPASSWCTDLACLNVWSYDRLDTPCAEPATRTVRADNGDQYVVCDGHAMDASPRITGGRVLAGLPADSGQRHGPT